MVTYTPSELLELKLAIKDIADRLNNVGSTRKFSDNSPENALSNRQRQSLEFDKWRLIHKYVHATPFTTRQHIKRSEQWRQVVDHVREIGESEVLDWVLLQVQVAQNLERGIQDMRPRKNGACHGLLLEFVGDRKRKAHAVLRFAIAGEEEGANIVNSKSHAKTETILQRHSKTYRDTDEGHEGVPWMPGRTSDK